jgi:pantothenate kinase type III
MEDRIIPTIDGNSLTFKFYPEAFILCSCEDSKKIRFCKHISQAFAKPASVFANKEDVESIEWIIHEYEHKQTIGIDLQNYFIISNQIEELQKKQKKVKNILDKKAILTNNGLLLLDDFDI